MEARASEDGTRATIEIADTGPGISVDDLPHVAEELYRGQVAQGIEGSGLGLRGWPSCPDHEDARSS